MVQLGYVPWQLTSYPNNKLILGCYLGPAINIGLALMAKIFKLNGVFVCRSTLWHLTDEVLNSSVHQEMQCKFDESIKQHLGPVAVLQEIPAEGLWWCWNNTWDWGRTDILFCMQFVLHAASLWTAIYFIFLGERQFYFLFFLGEHEFIRKDLKCVVRRRRHRPSSVPIEFPRKYISISH